MSALVNCFGLYLRADAASANMHDLAGFRCQVGVDDLADVPESLAISLGEIVVTVPVRLERSSPFEGDDRGTPFVGGDHREGGDQTDPLGRSLARRIPVRGEGSDSRVGVVARLEESAGSSGTQGRRRAFGGPLRCSDEPPSGATERPLLGSPLCPSVTARPPPPTVPFSSRIAWGGEPLGIWLPVRACFQNPLGVDQLLRETALLSRGRAPPSRPPSLCLRNLLRDPPPTISLRGPRHF